MLRARHVLAAALLLVACGGRYASVGDGDGGSNGSGATTGSGGSGQGGKKPGGHAGTTAVGGSVGVAGSGTAGTGVSVGGKSMCGPCPDIDCAPGSYFQPDPNGCCGTCIPLDCRNVACPGIACGSGSQLIYPPDQCCPVCGPTDCEAQRKGYFEFRSQVVEKYNSLGCMQDSDCAIIYESNACGSSCGTPMPWFYEKDFIVTLDGYASTSCASCPPTPIQPCPAPPPVACINARCQYRPF